MCGLFILLALAGFFIGGWWGLIVALLVCICIGVAKR